MCSALKCAAQHYRVLINVLLSKNESSEFVIVFTIFFSKYHPNVINIKIQLPELNKPKLQTVQDKVLSSSYLSSTATHKQTLSSTKHIYVEMINFRSLFTQNKTVDFVLSLVKLELTWGLLNKQGMKECYSTERQPFEVVQQLLTFSHNEAMLTFSRSVRMTSQILISVLNVLVFLHFSHNHHLYLL